MEVVLDYIGPKIQRLHPFFVGAYYSVLDQSEAGKFVNRAKIAVINVSEIMLGT